MQIILQFNFFCIDILLHKFLYLKVILFDKHDSLFKPNLILSGYFLFYLMNHCKFKNFYYLIIIDFDYFSKKVRRPEDFVQLHNPSIGIDY